MWYVRFIPNETDHVDVTIDGRFWYRWVSSQGDVTVPLSFNQHNQKIHVLAVGQEGKNATIEVRWDGDVKKKMDFDGADGENHDVER